MRELTVAEIESVSGAGIFTDAFRDFGQGIGDAIDIGNTPGNKGEYGAAIGSAIGALADGGLNLIKGIGDFGVNSIAQVGAPVIDSVFNGIAAIIKAINPLKIG
ncbi:hypothetical protein EKN56_11015 [Limnobaculum zhutongyuii]|uniref:Uncharacterized protein n=1 Tax=Limnobaculum zhutongyuii TaxID=2498113 RepID=A0A411WKY0_9GAMM|nr:hypothetical protein [Limnobaculum zhutongyuii]QBH96881.1 hypothetical protein EKN56_11015 [Limnobaculum zhutongyuii]TQS86985.1 hypothetical protein ELQ32_16330 [Limnobaculum zhutongyuii]